MATPAPLVPPLAAAIPDSGHSNATAATCLAMLSAFLAPYCDCATPIFVENDCEHLLVLRCITVHPSQPLLLTSSDDMTIRLWDWDKNWTNTQTYEGHSHYVMMVAFNPKDANTFASASLDRTVKVWGLGTLQPHFTLEGHEKGVNCIDYFSGGDRPYLVSGADDNIVKVWDYQVRCECLAPACLSTSSSEERLGVRSKMRACTEFGRASKQVVD